MFARVRITVRTLLVPAEIAVSETEFDNTCVRALQQRYIQVFVTEEITLVIICTRIMPYLPMHTQVVYLCKTVEHVAQTMA